MNIRDRLQQTYGAGGGGGDEGEANPPPAGKAAARAPSTKRGSPRGGTQGVKEEASRLLKSVEATTGPVAEGQDDAPALLKSGEDPGVAKAAKFLLLLGTEEAARVLGHLPPDEIEAVCREILRIKSIDPIEAETVLTEFGWLARRTGPAMEGGAETAERMLTAAFGKDRARAFIRKAAPDSLKPFRFLADFGPRELQIILKDESPQVLAVILPHLDPKPASGLIERLPEEARIEVVKRIAKLEKVDPEVLRRVEESLKERIRRIGTVTTQEVDGKAALASILRHTDTRMEERILSILDEESPEISRSVRERLFTLDDVLRVPSRELQKALRDFSDRDLALVLKGRSDEFREKLLSCVSKNRAELILDEYRILGAVRRDDADAAARSLLSWLKQAWDQGEIALEGDEDLVY